MKANQPNRSPMALSALATACCLILLSALAACGKKNDGQTVGQKLDTAVAKTEQAAADAKAKTEASMVKAEDAIKSAANKAEDSGKSTANKAADVLSDASVTAAVSAEFVKDSDLSAFKINVDTKSGNVTLNGPAPTLAAKEKATSLAKAVKGVLSVDNKLIVKAG